MLAQLLSNQGLHASVAQADALASERRRDGKAKCPGGLCIDDQLKLTCLYHRHVCRLLALKDAARVDAGLMMRVR